MLTNQKNQINESFIIINIFFIIICVNAAPKLLEKKSWPSLKQYNIWDTKQSLLNDNSINNIELTKNNLKPFKINNDKNQIINNESENRLGKVLSFFPVPERNECSANDGRRIGTCLDVYECRKKGGQGKGECALGFGVCCVFVASCDHEITTNITYLVSPNFPSFMRNNIAMCKIKIKLINSDISQLRIDFHHMVLGQPNRKTGNCDGDILQVFGGPGGEFTICGQNSGQHIYYDVGGHTVSRQSNVTMNNIKPSESNITNNITLMDSGDMMNVNSSISNSSTINNDKIEEEGIGIVLKFTGPAIQTRFWEIRIMQIPFSQRAPTGCLQYFTGAEGLVQTFNFADNGRHLANQNYKSCIRQEREMCSIAYEPCDEHSFRIGPNSMNDEISNILSDDNFSTPQPPLADPILTTTSPVTLSPVTAFNDISNATFVQSDNINTSEANVQQSSPLPDTADDTVEGSGDGSSDIPSTPTAAPVRDGFDILSFFRSTFFDYRRSGRQQNFPNFPSHQERSHHYSYHDRSLHCTDRVTMPCIVEDFIADGSNFFGCEPVHCGMQFCSSTNQPCRIESTVTPFYLGIHFGNGSGKGSADENIGACLRYKQMRCM